MTKERQLEMVAENPNAYSEAKKRVGMLVKIVDNALETMEPDTAQAQDFYWEMVYSYLQEAQGRC